MIVGVDVRPTERPASRRRGIGMYTRRLTDALLEKNRALGSPHRFVLVDSRSLPAIRRPSRLQWLVDRWTLPRYLRRNGIEAFHATDFASIPAARGTRVLAHVHDMIPFVFWADYSRRIPADFRWALRAARQRIQLAARVITDSEHSRRDIVAATGCPEGRIEVVYFGPVTQAGATVEAPQRAPDYFLYVGGTDFRKNLPFLIRGFARFAQSQPHARLVLAGETFRMEQLPEVREVLDEIERHAVAPRVERPGFVCEAELRALYRGAVALVFPSLYEGFGVPVLEAMALGAPVAAARTSSIPEILGDAGLYFDPRDESTLAGALETLWSDSTLRERLRAVGRSRALRFTWEGAADKVFRLYEQLERDSS